MRATEAVSLKLPEVPVIVTTVYVFGVAEVLAASVSKLLPVVGLVTHDADTPLGRPEVTARLTLPVNPA